MFALSRAEGEQTHGMICKRRMALRRQAGRAGMTSGRSRDRLIFPGAVCAVMPGRVRHDCRRAP